MTLTLHFVPGRALTTAVLTLFSGTALCAGTQNCTLVERVCTMEDTDGTCTRYDSEYSCEIPDAERNRCTAENPVLADCVIGEAVCKQTAGTVCLETETPVTCPKPVTAGNGLTPKDPVITVSYTTKKTGTVPAGCAAEPAVCTDDTPRTITVSNAPHLTTTASPACWQKVQTVACPSESAAVSCQTLVSAGCTRTGDVKCETTDSQGTCTRWSAQYTCDTEVKGDNLVTEDKTEIPQEPVVNTSACDKAIATAAKEGLTCTPVNEVCADADCTQKTVTLSCKAPAKDGCTALNQLAGSGDCLLTEPPVCESQDSQGTCLRESSTFVCADKVTTTTAGGATALNTASVPNYTAETKTCKNDAGATATVATKGCTQTEDVCTEGPGIRFVNGKPVWKDCWAHAETWVCKGAGENECLDFEKDPACKLVSESCPDGTETCDRKARVYSCRRGGTTSEVGQACDGELCIGDDCRPAPAPGDNAADYVAGLVQMEIARQAGVYGNVAENRFFGGMHSTCKDRTGATSCCRAGTAVGTSNTAFTQLAVFGAGAAVETIKFVGSPYVYDLLSWSDSTSGLLSSIYGSSATGAYSPSFSFWGATATYSTASGWAFSFSPAGFLASAAMTFYAKYTACSAADQRTAMGKGERLCHFVGFTCDSSAAGLGCIKKVEHHVCFNSRFARVINEQGRPQLGRTFGTPENPDIRGFTAEELQKLDFSKMDLSEIIEDVLKDLPTAGSVTADNTLKRAQDRVNQMVSGSVNPYSPMPQATGVTAGAQPTTGVMGGAK